MRGDDDSDEESSSGNEKKLDKDALLRKYQDMLDMRMRGK